MSVEFDEKTPSAPTSPVSGVTSITEYDAEANRLQKKREQLL